MLPGGTLDAQKMLAHALDLGAALSDALLFVVFVDDGAADVVLDGLDRAGLEGLPFSENDFGVGVGLRLVFAREVQVDVRLLVALEAHEGLEGDVAAVFQKLRSALRTDLVRHVPAGVVLIGAGLLGVEFRIAAVRAAVMRRQRIHFRDLVHGRGQGGADGAAASDQIAVGKRLADELVRNRVHDRVAVGNDGVELVLETLFHLRRQRIAVERLCACESMLPKVLVGILDDGRVFVRMDRGDLIHHVCDLPRILDDHLAGLFAAEVIELRQHLVRRMEIKRRLKLRVGIAFRILQDRAVQRVVGIHEMHVSRRADRLSELLAEGDDLAVQISEVFVRLNVIIAVFPLEVGIVADGLDLQVIIEGDDAGKLLVRYAPEDCVEQLAFGARRADDEVLPVFLQKGLRDARISAEILQVGIGNDAVQLAPPGLVPDEDADVVVVHLADHVRVGTAFFRQFA